VCATIRGLAPLIPDVPDDDRLLVRAFLDARTDAAFLALYRRHARVLFGLAVRLIGRQDAEDVVQDAWVRAIRALPGFKWESSLRTWLCGIVVNCCRERWRASTSLFPFEEPVTVMHPERALDIESALAQLSPGYRSVVVLYDVYGYTHPEIARLLECEVGTSKSQLARGRRALRELLETPAIGGQE